MGANEITVQEAIYRGAKEIALPSRLILNGCSLLCILLLIFYFSWWDLLLIPIGVVLSVLYKMWATPKWKIWAYEHVEDIHQLQRTAEMYGLLPRGSHNKTNGMMSGSQRGKLVRLQNRLSGDAVFVDDFAIPDETHMNSRASGSDEPVMILNDAGIRLRSEHLFEWDEVRNERVVQITFHRMNFFTGANTSAGAKDVFRFEYRDRRLEIPLYLLDTVGWELDLLLYIYRGRFQSKFSNQARP